MFVVSALARSRRGKRQVVCSSADAGLPEVTVLRAREAAAVRLERFGEARQARAQLRALLRDLPNDVRLDDANAQFYAALSAADETAMMRRWVDDDSVSLSLPLQSAAVGTAAVSAAWRRTFLYRPKVDYVVRALRVTETTAWVVVDQTLGMSRATGGRSVATNVFRLVADEWLLLHHHCAPVLDGDSL